MKKLIFILLGCLSVDLFFGQCACCGSSSNLSAGEITPMAYSLNKNQWLGELYLDYRSFSGTVNPGIADHTINTAVNIKDMVITGMGLRYGINSKTSLVIQQPYIFINGTSTSSEAFGDLLSLINYKAFSRSNFIIGMQAGMEWPTGQYIVSGSGNSISTGSGSYDPVAGLNIVRAFKNSNLRANAFFKYTTKGFIQTNYGDFFGHQLGYSYFILNPASSCSPDSISKNKNQNGTSLSLNFQFSGEWSQAQMKDHVMIVNTGSYVNLAGIGITVGFKGFTIPVSLYVPVYQKFHGVQNRNVIRVRIGLTKTFN
jgi:hypothetical protein